MRKPSMIRLDIPRTEDSKHAGLAGLASHHTKLILRAMGVTVALTVSVWGNAASLGAINVVSALGQPLKAEIELSDMQPEDKPVIHLASPEAYKGAGLAYPYGVQYRFEIANRANGEAYLKVSSNREISDSFVSLLVELSWKSGRLMREYSFLLDPPGFVAIQPKAAEAQIIAPVAPEKKSENPAENQPASVVETQAKPAESVEALAEKRERAGKSEQDTSLIVKQGDFLIKIAAKNKPVDVSLDRMLVALYRANADKFDGKNMNRIQAGKILRMPDREEIHNVTQTEAAADIHAQAVDWNAYRQKLAGAASTRHEAETTRQVASGKITAPVADKTPVANESSREVLRLSRGEAPGSPATGRSVQKNAAAEDAIAKAKALEEGKMRAALLEKNLKDMQRLAQLKSEAAALKSSVSKETSGVLAAGEVAAVSHVAAASAVKPAAPASVSLIDQMKSLLEEHVLVVAGAGAAVLLGGLGFAFVRRRAAKKNQTAKAVSDATPVNLETPAELTSVESSMVDLAMPPADEVIATSDEVDPVSEAELLLTFGRDEQAEEVLKDALLHTPDNHQIHLKLLDIYAKRQDVASFDKIAALLEKSGDIDAIQQAENLALTLLPVNAQEESSQLVESEAQPDKVAADLTGSLPAGTTEARLPDVTVEEPVAETVEEIPAVEETAAVENTPLSSVESEVLNFDSATQEAEALPSLDDLIFDVSGTGQTAVDLPVEKTLEEDDGMEFTLDFPQDNIEDKQSPPGINLADISLDMDDIQAPAAEETAAVKSELWHEVATKLDLAKAYQEMGDEVGAREILDEVILEGDAEQQLEAQLLIKQLS